MGKKIIIIIASIFVLALGIWTAFKIIDDTKDVKENNISNEIVNFTNISEEYVTDECMNEWKDYAEKVEEDLKQANSNIEDENTKYMIRNRDDYITIYKVEETGEEILYKTTNIYTEYLTEEDLELLNNGIQITGREELNSLLEDFE